MAAFPDQSGNSENESGTAHGDLAVGNDVGNGENGADGQCDRPSHHPRDDHDSQIDPKRLGRRLAPVGVEEHVEYRGHARMVAGTGAPHRTKNSPDIRVMFSLPTRLYS